MNHFNRLYKQITFCVTLITTFTCGLFEPMLHYIERDDKLINDKRSLLP